MSAVRYRPATLADAELAADMMTAAYPAMPQDPVIMRLRWESPRKGFAHGRFIAEGDGAPIGYLGWIHGPWDKLPDRHCEVEVWLEQRHLDRGLLVAMFAWIGEQAIADGARLLMSYCAEDEPEMLDSLAALGYRRERIERCWELDLRKHGARLVADAKRACDRQSGEGIELTTLARWSDPNGLRKLLELSNLTAQDVPHTLPIIDETYDDFARRMEAPDRPHDRIWIALHDNVPVSLSYLKFPPVRGPATRARIPASAVAASPGRSSSRVSPRPSSSACRWSAPTTIRRTPRCCTSKSSSVTWPDRDSSSTTSG